MKCTPGGAEGEPAVAGHPGRHRPAQPAPQPRTGRGVLAARTAVTATTRFLPARARVWLGLGSSFSGLQWIVDAYALTLAAFLLTAGSLSDMYGRRRLFLIGLVVFTGASLLCGFAAGTLMLQVSRAVQGVGGAVMFAVSLALLADAFRGKDRGVAFGIWGAITGIAVSVGSLLGGVLTSGISWR